MSSSSASRLAAAKAKLSKALQSQFQSKIAYRHGVIDSVTIGPDSRISAATMTVDGVQNVPIQVSPGVPLAIGDTIQAENRGSASAPAFVYDLHVASSYAAAGVSPMATLPTVTGLSVTSTLRPPTTGGQVAQITVSFRALAESVMGTGGHYEIAIKRDSEVDFHVSRVPHSLASTTLDGDATYEDSTVDVVSTGGFPTAGRIFVGDAEIGYTGISGNSFTGATWYSGSGTYDSGKTVTALTISHVFDHVETGKQYSVKVRACSHGATSDWSSWSSLKTAGNQQLQIQDNFDTYGGTEISSLESLYWLQIATFDTDEDWAAQYGTMASETSNFKEGDRGVKINCELIGLSDYLGAIYLDVSLDLENEARFTEDDYVVLPIYAHKTDVLAFTVYFFTNFPADHYYYTDSTPDEGWNYYKIKKSDFIDSGSPDWSDITRLVLHIAGTSVDDYMIADCWQICKADPDDPDTPNDTGTAWNFVGGEWHIYPGQ